MLRDTCSQKVPGRSPPASWSIETLPNKLGKDVLGTQRAAPRGIAGQAPDSVLAQLLHCCEDWVRYCLTSIK